MQTNDMDFGQVQVMELPMAFATKMMGFPSDLVSFLTKLPPKTQENGWLIFDRDVSHLYIDYLLVRELKCRFNCNFFQLLFPYDFRLFIRVK